MKLVHLSFIYKRKELISRLIKKIKKNIDLFVELLRYIIFINFIKKKKKKKLGCMQINDWLVVETYMLQLAILPIQQTFGLIFRERFFSLGITATQTSLIVHLNGTITCSLGLISGPMMKRFTFRKVAFLGGFIVIVGICAAAYAISLPSIILTYCIIVGESNRWMCLFVFFQFFFPSSWKRSISLKRERKRELRSVIRKWKINF